MSEYSRVLRAAGAAVLVASLAAACGGSGESADTTVAVPSVQLAPENVAKAVVSRLTSGPAISGQLTPAREATVRAQVGGSLVRLTVDKGQPVQAGAEIARIASRDLEDSLQSARVGVKSAETSLALAQSERQRTENLVKGGALAARDLELAQSAVSNAEAALAAAKSRERSAAQQIEDTSIRAPFAGIVSDRPASAGDVVSPGTPIVTIIDPSSLRLEALVPSDAIASVQPGAPVQFSIRGFPNQTFAGRVDRLSPTADPVTRQVAIFVTLPNMDGRLIAGLFAEGRVQVTSREGVVVPAAAVDETGVMPTVTRIREGRAERVAVELGLRQAETERVEVIKGITAGDIVILGAARSVAPGTLVRVVGRGGK